MNSLKLEYSINEFSSVYYLGSRFLGELVTEPDKYGLLKSDQRNFLQNRAGLFWWRWNPAGLYHPHVIEREMSYLYVFLTIILTVYGQIAIKWNVAAAGAFPTSNADRIVFLARLLLNPWILSALGAALLAAVSWMAAMTKLELSHAYPFMSLSFVLVAASSALFFHEPITPLKIAGLALIVLGIVVGSQG